MAVSATITAADNFTDWISPRYALTPGAASSGQLNLSVWGTWTGTVTIQRTFDDGTTILDVETYTENSEQIVDETERGIKYRVGVASGVTMTGTVDVRLA